MWYLFILFYSFLQELFLSTQIKTIMPILQNLNQVTVRVTNHPGPFIPQHKKSMGSRRVLFHDRWMLEQFGTLVLSAWLGKIKQIKRMMNIRVEWFYIEKFQNVNFEKPVVLKVAHVYSNKKIVLQLFKILKSSTRASALKIKNFIAEATF
jgi:hypothetical protein